MMRDDLECHYVLASATYNGSTPPVALETALAEIAALRAKLATLERRRSRVYSRLAELARRTHDAVPGHDEPFDHCAFLGCSSSRWYLRHGGPLRG